MNDHLALVTGTSSGIGAALADALLKDHWTVVGLSRRTSNFTTPLYRHVAVDLGDLETLRSIAETEIAPLLREAAWGRVGLVNNAAMEGAMRGIEHFDLEDLARLYAVNTIAPIYLMGLVARTTQPTTPLRIVNISSGAAVYVMPGTGDYSSSKAALRMAGMVLAAELDSDQRPGGRRLDAGILSYEPGVVDTSMQERARTTAVEQFPWKQPFVDFASQGLLQPPAEVIWDVIDFLSYDRVEPFTERRFQVT